MLAIIIASVISNNAFSQTSKNIDGGKSQPVVWKRVEQPVKSVDSNFRLDLSTLMTGTNYIIGVKPAKDGEKEKMYTGIVTWESNEKIKGFLRTSSIENYPEEAESFSEGKISFNNRLAANQTLVIYVEVAPATRLTVNAESEMTLDSSGGSFVIFDGKKDEAKIDGPGSLLNELQIRKVTQEMTKDGIKVVRKEND